jgi:NAD(P)-dependent dehydrogenase (short-subunit alcohol dehydrogenase family)
MRGKELQKQGLRVEFIQLDVTKPAQIRNAAALIRKRFGKLDILVNNAGASVGEDLFQNSTATVTPKALRKTFDVNFFGLVELTQKLLPLIEKSDAGRIVNVSSILASLAIHSKEGGLSYKPFAYDASKTVVNAFTIHLAAALSGTRSGQLSPPRLGQDRNGRSPCPSLPCRRREDRRAARHPRPRWSEREVLSRG